MRAGEARIGRTGCTGRVPRPATSSAMLRFSQAAVPTGNVPSTGIALTGSSSPRPAMISAVNLLHESRRRRGHDRRALEIARRRLSGS